MFLWLKSGFVLIAIIGFVPAGVFGKAAGQSGVPACNPSIGVTHSVVGVKDARTIVVDDGSVVRLSGIMPPLGPRSGKADDPRSLEGAAIKALSDMVLGRVVALAFVSPKRDRYGTVQAHVFVKDAADGLSTGKDGTARSLRGRWVQEGLVAGGYVRAYEPAGQSDCYDLLSSFERTARKKGLGLWGYPAYRAIAASDISRLWKSRGSYVRVVGRVRSVAQRSAFTYLNFGDNWRDDFTIVVPRTVARDHPGWAAGLGLMASKTVEVEGWIRAKNGPSILLERPGQLRLSE